MCVIERLRETRRARCGSRQNAQRQAVDDQNAAQQVTLRIDPVTSRLAAMLGIPSARIDLLSTHALPYVSSAAIELPSGCAAPRTMHRPACSVISRGLALDAARRFGWQCTVLSGTKKALDSHFLLSLWPGERGGIRRRATNSPSRCVGLSTSRYKAYANTIEKAQRVTNLGGDNG